MLQRRTCQRICYFFNRKGGFSSYAVVMPSNAGNQTFLVPVSTTWPQDTLQYFLLQIVVQLLIHVSGLITLWFALVSTSFNSKNWYQRSRLSFFQVFLEESLNDLPTEMKKLEEDLIVMEFFFQNEYQNMGKFKLVPVESTWIYILGYLDLLRSNDCNQTDTSILFPNVSHRKLWSNQGLKEYCSQQIYL